MQPDQNSEFSRSLREKVDTHKAPDHLRRKILASLEQERQPQQMNRVAGFLQYLNNHWRALSTAAACGVAATLLATQVSILASGNDLERQIAASHSRAMMTNHLIDVASSDRHTVKPWFADKIDYSPKVKDYATEGFTLTGGRLDHVNDRTVATLVYKNHLHVIDVYTWPVAGANAEVNKRSHQGINMVEWIDGGMKYVAVSDIEFAELSKLAQLMRTRQGE